MTPAAAAAASASASAAANTEAVTTATAAGNAKARAADFAVAYSEATDVSVDAATKQYCAAANARFNAGSAAYDAGIAAGATPAEASAISTHANETVNAATGGEAVLRDSITTADRLADQAGTVVQAADNVSAQHVGATDVAVLNAAARIPPDGGTPLLTYLLMAAVCSVVGYGLYRGYYW
jgi:hypothetical protein